MNDPIRVLIVDDHPVVREGLRLMLETSPDFTIVGDAADGQAAVRAAADLHPDVVLMDLRLPVMSGADATRSIAASTSVVVLTTYDEGDLVLEAVAAGAVAYLRKDCELRALHAAIRSAARGHSTISRSLLIRALARHRSQAARPQLTSRETEVIRLAAAGHRNLQIAAALGVTERTIRGHLSSVYTKLSAQSRTAAIARAREYGLLE
ncbi:MAG: response regulator transcription factor [Streptosporangiaceae bacterium]|nr:response regulator transcription factor [Streptosporangiaceae bacterium]MBV9854046.1 response regulator transcription factor [Streptosporangiaceae bacterium]